MSNKRFQSTNQIQTVIYRTLLQPLIPKNQKQTKHTYIHITKYRNEDLCHLAFVDGDPGTFTDFSGLGVETSTTTAFFFDALPLVLPSLVLPLIKRRCFQC